MHKKLVIVTIFAILFGQLFIEGYHYRWTIYNYFRTHKYHSNKEFDQFFAQWKVYGIDVSEYQGSIDWQAVDKIFGQHQINFVFIRATAGKDKIDAKFKQNWKAKKHKNIMQGAYHYYRPDENSVAQANNFIATVTLKKGDLPPVLDIERIPNIQSLKRLRTGLQKWLKIVAKHYGVKPIIYSGSAYFTKYLKATFKDYTLWVANYNRTKVPVNHDWKIWQYSSNGVVDGVFGKVDINVFDGKRLELQRMCLH